MKCKVCEDKQKVKEKNKKGMIRVYYAFMSMLMIGVSLASFLSGSYLIYYAGKISCCSGFFLKMGIPIVLVSVNSLILYSYYYVKVLAGDKNDRN